MASVLSLSLHLPLLALLFDVNRSFFFNVVVHTLVVSNRTSSCMFVMDLFFFNVVVLHATLLFGSRGTGN